jgi:hypothetical protein
MGAISDEIQGILDEDKSQGPLSIGEEIGSILEGARQERTEENVAEMGDVARGWERGKKQLAGTFYGFAGLAGAGLEKAIGIGEGLQNWGYEGYKAKMEEASEYPASFELGDIMKGEGVLDKTGRAIDWAQGTAGELMPSMIEAVLSGVTGAAVGSAAAPGPGTAAGAVAGFFGRRVRNQLIKQTMKRYVAKGVPSRAAKKHATRWVDRVSMSALQKQGMKQFGAKAGVVAGVMPMEAGGNWGENMEMGINNPVSALATGSVAALIELASGNMRIVNKVLGPQKAAAFRRAVTTAKKSVDKTVTNRAVRQVAKIAKEAGIQAPWEFGQEAGQEFMSMVNVAVNDPSFEMFTEENLNRMFEAGMAGAVGGVMGGMGSYVVDTFRPAPVEEARGVREIGLTQSLQEWDARSKEGDTFSPEGDAAAQATINAMGGEGVGEGGAAPPIIPQADIPDDFVGKQDKEIAETEVKQDLPVRDPFEAPEGFQIVEGEGPEGKPTDFVNGKIFVPKGMSKDKQAELLTRERHRIDFNRTVYIDMALDVEAVEQMQAIAQETLAGVEAAIREDTPADQIQELHDVLPETVEYMKQFYGPALLAQSDQLEEAYAAEMGFEDYNAWKERTGKAGIPEWASPQEMHKWVEANASKENLEALVKEESGLLSKVSKLVAEKGAEVVSTSPEFARMNQLRSAQEAMNERLMQTRPADIGGILSRIDREETADDFYEPPLDIHKDKVSDRQIAVTQKAGPLFGLGKLQPVGVGEGLAYFNIVAPDNPANAAAFVVKESEMTPARLAQKALLKWDEFQEGEGPATLIDDPDAVVAQAQKKPLSIIADEEAELIKGISQGSLEVTIPKEKLVRFKSDVLTGRAGAPVALSVSAEQAGLPLGHDTYAIERPYGMVYFEAATGKLFWKPQVSEAQVVKLKKGEIEAGMNLDRMQTILEQQALGGTPEASIVDELVQNSIDAFVPGGEKTIHVGYDYDGDKPILKFADTGRGMSPDDVRKHFVVLAGKGKAGTTTAGGYGIAKAAFLFHPDRVQMETVRKAGNKKTIAKFDATKDEIRSGKWAFETGEVSDDEDVGTKLTLTFPDGAEMYKIRSRVERHAENTRIPGIKFNIEGDATTTKGFSYKKAYPTEAFTDKHGNRAKLYFRKVPRTEARESGGRYEVNVGTYNHGIKMLNIASWRYDIKLAYKPDFALEINFERTAEPESDGYPFIDNRRTLNSAVMDKIIEMVELKTRALEQKGLQGDVDEWKRMYKTAPEVGGIKVMIPFKDRSHRKKARAIFRDNKEVFEDFSAVSEWIGRKLRDAGLASPDMEMAITVDPNVHGSRSVPSVVGDEVYAINPFALISQFEDPANKADLEKYAKQYGRTISHLQAAIITHAYVHEFTHKEHYGHNEQFTTGMADYYKKLTHSELAEVENELIKIFERHSGRIEAIAASLQEFSKGGSRFFTRDALAAPLQEHGPRREGAPGEVRGPSTGPVEGETRFQVEDTGYPKTWPKEYTDEAFAIRDRVARGDLDVASAEFRDIVDDLNARWGDDPRVKGAVGLRLNNLRHAPNARFEITKEKVYGPIKKGEIGKAVTLRPKVLKQTPKGPIQVDEYYDERGRQIVPGIIFYPNKRTKMRQIGEILKKHKDAMKWYIDWAQFNQSFVDAGVSRDLMEKYIKIQAITSKQKGPQTNQDVFTQVLNKLEQDVPLRPGRIDNFGDGVEQDEIVKIMEIWNSQDFWIDSLEDRIARYGKKIGPYMQLGLYPWSDSVVLDRHMAHPWGFDNAFSFGPKALSSGDWHQRADFAVDVRKEIEADIRAAAKKFNQPVGAVQAAIWYEARLPDVQASTYKEATGLSEKMIPKEMHKAAAIPGQHAIHYSEAARDEIRGAHYGESVPSYSKEVESRMYSGTDAWPYVPTGDFYLKETGGHPEGVVKTSKKVPHVAGLKNIYDLDRDLLGYRERAADIKYNEMMYGKATPHTSNVLAKLIQDAGYLGFARTMGPKAGKWAAVFGETPVKGPISTTLQISEVAENFETLPQSLGELEWYAENRNPELVQELKDMIAKRYPEVTMGASPSTFARFGSATSGKLEYGVSAEMNGPLNSIRALAAEVVGLAKHQNMVFLVGDPKSMEKADPNGTMTSFRVNDSVDKAELEKRLAKHGIDEYNIKEVKGSVYFDQFIHDDEGATKFPPIQSLYQDIGVPGSMEFDNVFSEGIGDAAEGPNQWSGNIEDIRANYEKILVEHFGKERGGEIYAEGLKKGLLWADEGKTRERTALHQRNRGDQGPDEGGPDNGLPQPEGPTTKAQVARKGFDPRRSLADQTVNPDTVERISTMVSAVDEAFKRANFTPTDYYNDFKVKFQPIIDLREFKNVEASIREHGMEGKKMSNILAASTINQMNALVTFSTEQDLNTMERTAWHETWHLIEPFIPSDQMEILKKHYKTGEGRADAYRDFIGGLEGRPIQHGAVRRAFRKIRRFFQLIKNALAGKGFTRPQDVFGRAFVGQFKPTGPRATRAGPVSTTALESEQRNAKWYSQMTDALMKKLPEKSTAANYKNMIQGMADKGAFKPEELKYSGIIEDLEALGKKRITREKEIADILLLGSVVLDEEVLEGGAAYPKSRAFDYGDYGDVVVEADDYYYMVFNKHSEGPRWADYLDYDADALKGDFPDMNWTDEEVAAIKNYQEENEAYAEYQTMGEPMGGPVEQLSPPHEAVYTADTPAGVYTITEMQADKGPHWNVERQEADVTDAQHGWTWIGDAESFDDAESIANADLESRWSPDMDEDTGGTHHQGLTEPGGEDYTEMLLKWDPESHRFRGEGFPGEPVHFGGRENIIASIRFKTRYDKDGKKVLAIEEIQSDWHQQGFKRGYAGQPIYVAVKEGDLVDRLSGGRHDPMWVAKHRKTGEIMEGPYGGETRYTTKEAVEEAIRARGPIPLPDAPWKTSWQLLAMKRMVRYAAENGFDRIAWTEGFVQAKRYNMASHFKRIQWDADTNILRAVPVDDSRLDLAKQVSRDELGAYMGDDLAAELLKDENRTGLKDHGVYVLRQDAMALVTKKKARSLANVYDKQYPNIFNRFFGKAKWGKPQLNREALPASNVSIQPVEGRPTPEIPDQTRPFWVADITPEMRETALKEGFTQFQGDERPPLFGTVGDILASKQPRRVPTDEERIKSIEAEIQRLREARDRFLEKDNWKSANVFAKQMRRHQREIDRIAGVTRLQISDTRPEGIKRLFGKRHKTFREKTNETFQAMKTKGFWDTVVTQTLDRVSPVQKAGEKAYQLKRIETGLQAVFAMAMEHGKLKWDPSGVITTDEKRRGFIPFLRSLGKDWDKFFYWVAGKRGEVLEAEGRERWLNKKERQEIFDWTRPSTDAEWAKKAEELAEFNNSILDLAERAGLINPSGRRKWQQQYYVPFYRIFEDEAAKGEFLRAPQKNRRFISAQIKRLKGAERKLGDPLENMMHNWMHLIGESMRNVARAEAYRWSMENSPGLVEPTTVGKTKYYRQSKDGKVVYAMDKTDEPVLTFQHMGKPVYFKVNDPELYNALGDINTQRLDNLFVNLMRTTKRWLTFGATFGPAFRVANMLRDTLHTSMLEKSFKPFLDTAKGFWKTWREDENYVRLMASGAGFGSSYVRADDPEAAASYINRIIKKEGQGAADRILNTPKKMLDWWERVGSASENAARVQLFANLTEEGAAGREAAFRARDLLDFTMSGEHAAVQLLIQTIPFLNARAQGLYRLGRGIKNTENRGNFALRGSLLMAASLALWGFNKDDDRYKELEDWDRWQYYHVWIGGQHFRIPKPFEVGAFFSSLPESMLDSLAGDDRGKHFWNFLGHTFTETFAVSAPQLFVPILEQWANKSFFTGRPIVPERLKGLKEKEQYEPWTSEAMRTLAGGLGVSPKRAQELVRGYFATLGELILAGTDIGFRNAFDYPERADWRVEDYPLAGRFLRDQPPRYTKQMSWFYRAMEEADRTVKTINHFKRTGRYKEAAELQTMEKNRIRNRASLSKARTRLRKLNRRIRRINMDPALSGKQKREQLDKLTEKRNQIVSQMYELHNGEV